MGVIERQSIKGTILTYTGVVVGFINTGLILPKILFTEQIGLLNILIAYSLVFSQIATLGFNNTTVKLFPYFRKYSNGHNGFLFISILTALVGFLIVLSIFLFIYPYVIDNPNDGSDLLNQYGLYIIPLSFFSLIFNSLDVYNRVLYNSVTGVFLKEFFVRIMVLIDISLFYFNIFSFEKFVISYIIIYCLPAIIILAHLVKQGQFKIKPQFGFLTKELVLSMIGVSLFGIISGFAGMAVVNIDKIMINQMLGLDDTGIYSIAFYFGSLIIMPSRPLINISSTFIADSWKKNDLDTIRIIYKKSVINQTIIGLLVFVGLVGNINNILEILPKEYSAGMVVIIFIAMSFLLDMFVGVSSSIIGNSKYYRIQTYFMILLIILLFITNLVFIPKYGITGAAFASFISKFVVNALKVSFIFFKFNLFPYNSKILLALIISGISYFFSFIFPAMNSVIFDILIRSAIITVSFIVLIFIFKVSEEVNSKIKSVYNKLINRA